jgi:hypothetical protein
VAENYAFDGANKVFTDREQFETGEDRGRPDMFVFFNGLTAFSRWKLTEGEIEEINRTGEIVLAQLLGGNNKMPQTFVGSEKHVRVATMDLVGRPLPQTFTKLRAAND